MYTIKYFRSTGSTRNRFLSNATVYRRFWNCIIIIVVVVVYSFRTVIITAVVRRMRDAGSNRAPSGLIGNPSGPGGGIGLTSRSKHGPGAIRTR